MGKQCVVWDKPLETRGVAKTCPGACRQQRARQNRLKAQAQYYARNIERLRLDHRERAKRRYDADKDNLLAKARAWKKANREKIRAQQRQWQATNRDKRNRAACERYHADPEKTRHRYRLRRAVNLEQIRKQESDRYWRNRDKIARQVRARNERNPEPNRARARNWAKANPDRVHTTIRNRRARKRAASGSHTAADIREIRKAQGNKCAYCRTKLREGKVHVDHILALVNGGTNDRRNLQVTCDKCNLSKRARDPIIYAQSIGLLL